MIGSGTNGRLIEGYLREVEASLRVDAERKRQIVDELRSHLREQAADRKAADMARSDEDVEREVLAEFGNPRDLALSYEPEGMAVLKDTAGRTVHTFSSAVGRGAKAVGRGAGKFLKIVAITLGVLLILAVGVAGWAYYEFKPYFQAMAEESSPVYSFAEKCAATPCWGAMPGDLFYVSPTAKNVRFDIQVYHAHDRDSDAKVGNGTVSIVVADPNGAILLNRTYDLTDGEGFVDQRLSWAAVSGNWSVAIDFQGFQGIVDVEAYATSVNGPWTE